MKSRYVSRLLRFLYKMQHKIQYRVFTPLENVGGYSKWNKRGNPFLENYGSKARPSRFKLFTPFHINRQLALFRWTPPNILFSSANYHNSSASDSVIFHLNIMWSFM